MALTLKNTVAQRAATRPAARVAVPARRPMRVMASAQSDKAAVAGVAAGVAALSFAVVPAAQAAQEALVLAEGEPAIVQVGWAATAAVFSFSLALVVWGRSGM